MRTNHMHSLFVVVQYFKFATYIALPSTVENHQQFLELGITLEVALSNMVL